jgi:hypothetical protein
MRGAVFDSCGHSIEKNRIKDRKHDRCRLCQNAANEAARAKRLARQWGYVARGLRALASRKLARAGK